MTQGQEQRKMVTPRHERSRIPLLSRPLWSLASTRIAVNPELPIEVNKLQQRFLFSVPSFSVETSSSSDEYDSSVDSETGDDELDRIIREQQRRVDDNNDDDLVVNVFRNITSSMNNRSSTHTSITHNDDSDDEYEENDGDIWTLKRAHPILDEGSESDGDNESTVSILDKASTRFQPRNLIDTSVYNSSISNSNVSFASPKKKQRRDDDDDDNQSYDSLHNDRFVIPPSPVTNESSLGQQEQPVNLCYKASAYEFS